LIACEGPRLVREDILDLAKLLIEVTCLYASWHIIYFVVHQDVPFDKHPLEVVSELESQQQRDGDEICKEKKPSTASLYEKQETIYLPGWRVLFLQIGYLHREIPHGCVSGCDDTESKLNDQDHDD